MSVEQGSSPVEIARHAAVLSSSDDERDAHLISGIAIGEGDVTRGQSGIKKKWTREALKPAAETLEGRPLVVDHENSSYGTVGKVTRVEYQDNVGVLYEAELYDEELAEKIENGLLEVSIRGFHESVDEMAEDSETDAKVVTKAIIDNLSIVPSGAAPSNTVEAGSLDDVGISAAEASESITVESGPSTEYSAAECAEMLGVDMEDEEEAGRAEGAEKHGNPEKEDEEPERFPGGNDTPEDELSEENADGDGTDVEQTSPSDDADAAESQNVGAGASEEPESILANLTLHKPTMTDNIEEQLEDYDDAHVIEGDELSELREQAQKVEDLEAELVEMREADEDSTEETSGVEELKEQFEDDLSELKERTAVLDEVDRADVESLAETDSPVIVEEDDYDELQESVDTVRGIYAEALSEHVALDAETIEDKFGIAEMREQIEEFVDEDSSVEEELSPNLDAADVEEEELEEVAEEEHEEEQLSADVEEEQARLRAQMGLSD